jgi:peptidoglycan/xylan/chitin deacetylase (PgdA/CDA1 family)
MSVASSAIPFARSGDEMTRPQTIVDAAKQFVLRRVLDRVRPIAYRRSKRGIRCLTFHYMFENEREHAYRMFTALRREGDFVTTQELVALLQGQPRTGQSIFHLSIDDGFYNVGTIAHPVLKSLRIPYSLMVCPAFIGGSAAAFEQFRQNARYQSVLPLADWDMLARLAAEGVEIGAHTLTHREISRLSGREMIDEIVEPKRMIERQLGTPCISFAWPFGRSSSMSEAAIAIAINAGYRAIFSSIRGTLCGGSGMPQYLPRHHFEPSWPIDTVLYYATRAEQPFTAAALYPSRC